MNAYFSAISQILLLGFTLSGCSTPSQRIETLAAQLGYQRMVVAGQPWAHVLYRNTITQPDSILHVYLEGDGTPWIGGKIIATDPTARNPLALRLMAQDPYPALYLARPCYHHLKNTAPCPAQFWTSHRYSPAVVNSMIHALQHYLQLHQPKAALIQEMVLIGHSGGGTLAMLMAPKIPAQTVITIAANLDIEAWTRYHHYSPLWGSLNPAQQAPLPQTIKQWHFTGAEDTQVPATLIASALKNQPQAVFQIIPGYNHHCCWESTWKNTLQQLTRDLNQY